jgi:translocation and assembly module TamA
MAPQPKSDQRAFQESWSARAAFIAACACFLGFTPSAARADIFIDVRGVSEEVERNVLAYLSFERYRTSDDLSPDVLERLHNRVEREVVAALKPFGYYEPQVKSSLDSLGGGNWRVTIDIKPGRPIVMSNVDVSVFGPGAEDPLFQRILQDLPLRAGQRLNHAAYEKIKGDLQRTAATYGYLDAVMKRAELRVDPKAYTATATLHLESGPRYRFGTTEIEQNAIDESLVRRFMRYQQDEPFDLTELLRTQFALDDSQYFSSVEVLPGDPDRSEHIVPISIRAQPDNPSRYSFGVGYGTDTEVRGTASWENRRVNRFGHRFYVELEAAAIGQSLETRYTIPIGDPALEKLSFEITGEQEERGSDIESTSFNFEPSITRVRGRWQRVWFVTATRTTDEFPNEKRTDTLLIPGVSVASVPQGYLGEALFSRDFFAELRGSHSAFGSDSDFIQLRVQAERAFDISPRWHLLLRGEVAGSLVAEFSELPTSVRFFAGGDRSVRGFGYQELSPVRTIEETNPETGLTETRQIRTGGKHMITGTVELVRDLPRNLGIAAFFDFGNAFDEFGTPPDPNDGDFLEYSAGLGVRWRLPVVTLGVDIAQPLSESASPRLHINFSPKL